MVSIRLLHKTQFLVLTDTTISQLVNLSAVFKRFNLKRCLLFRGSACVFILTAILLASTADGSELKASPRANCDASYPDVCIPSSPPDLRL